jgi:hypothetical protein
MHSCFINPAPIGVSPPLDSDRKPIYRVYAGDEIRLETKVQLHDGTHATPENSIACFELRDQRFETDVVFEGSWRAGIELLDNDIVEILIPQSVADTVRRGSFLFGMTISDVHGNRRRTVFTGTLLVEYAPTSPHHDIPYKD